MDKTKLTEQKMEGIRAQEILQDPLNQKILAQLDERIEQGFKESKGDVEVMQHAYYLNVAKEEIVQMYQTHIHNGKVAEKLLASK